MPPALRRRHLHGVKGAHDAGLGDRDARGGGPALVLERRQGAPLDRRGLPP